MKITVNGNFETQIMRYRIFDFVTMKTIHESDNLMDLILYFNTEDADYNNCLMQEFDIKNIRYKSIGC